MTEYAAVKEARDWAATQVATLRRVMKRKEAKMLENANPAQELPVKPKPSELIAELVRNFSAALLEKLHAAEEKYGWNNGWIAMHWEADCKRQLLEHVHKGDPRDVAAYCAFMWHHGWKTTPVVEPVPDGRSNLEAILDDQPYLNSALSVHEIKVILANEGGFMPDEAVIWFREARGNLVGSALTRPPLGGGK
ncbi:hypothetical protein [Bradyrhizobium tunisiense]|uniref:hypothetical protein n=1 Tax=Bradyrhizobium tunisiense TaxID=3278709 RepID=UPI0035D71359